MTRVSHPITVLHALAPAPFGGLERVVEILAKGQFDAGLQVEVLTFLALPSADHWLSRTLRAQGVSTSSIVLPPRSYLAQRRALAGHLGRICPAVLHTHGYHADLLSTGLASKFGVSKVTTVHGFTGGGPKNRFYERLQRRAHRTFDRVVAVSHPLAQSLVDDGLEPSKIECIQNAWQSTEPPFGRESARGSLGVHSEAKVIGWVGRLSSEKGPDLLLEAGALIESPTLEVSVIGEGREESALRQQAHGLRIESRVHFHGRVLAAARVFRAFDVFVLSSRTEGTPIVLFEAMAAGVPIVATAVGGVPDVVSEREALLVPPGDPAALADAIRSTLEDPAAAATRVRAAEDRLAARYAVGPWVDRYTEIYRSIAP